MLVVIVGSELLKVIVPVTPIVIVSVPEPAEQPPKAASVFAAVIASRSEQFAPVPFSSTVVLTTMPANIGAAPTGFDEAPLVKVPEPPVTSRFDANPAA